MKNFVERWKNHGYEKGESQKFWIDFLQSLGVQNVLEKIFFEQQIHGKFIDARIPEKKVLIEQKSAGKNLTDAFSQAKNYDNELPFYKKSRWIICSDFQNFEIYDMNKEFPAPVKISLQNLEKNLDVFNFLIDDNFVEITQEEKISLQAGEIVQKIYDALKKNYLNPNSAESLQSLNKLCVRLVFCLYAESTNIFGDKKIFKNYLNQFSAKNLRHNLIRLFKVLDTKISDRDKYLEDDLKKFPYVNGNLFSEEIEIPNFNDEIKFFLLEYASRNFNWSKINPTIFGAVFESTLNPVTRREGGMHYTSIENIHKVIDNLFLDDLYDEFENCRKNRKKLLALQNKIANLKFFDPACGSGNFLTESYISLRRLENKILEELLKEKILLGELDNPVKVSINQFFGIEINDFAVSVAQTALWIAELQMLDETQNIIHKNLNPLPLKNFANIFEGNALRMDWEKILPIDINFIFGNPPFVGKTFQTKEQKADIKKFFKNSSVDYVACWYKKTYEFLNFCDTKNNFRDTKIPENTFGIYQNSEKTLSVYTKSPENNFCDTKIQCAFVSTNSITQGEQVAEIFANTPFIINFAYRTFRWDSESAKKAAVHCVIIGFALFHRDKKFIFDGKKKFLAKNINFYLDDAPNFFLTKRNSPLQKFIPKISRGSGPVDNGNLILSEDEKNILIKKFPLSEKFIRPLIGGEDFLHNKKRFCLWLVNATPAEIKKFPPIYERIKNVKKFRENSKRDTTKKLAEVPQLFAEIRLSKKNFLFFPQLSSENRKYIPIGFFDENFITVSPNFFIPDADLFLFGILESKVHMVWTKKFCGRLKSDFRYSAQIIYNNFPFPEVEKEIREKISETAEKILEVRRKYSDSSLAELYDENLMPKDLRDAHKKNDFAVLEAYGFEKNFSDEEILRGLIKIFKNLTEGE